MHTHALGYKGLILIMKSHSSIWNHDVELKSSSVLVLSWSAAALHCYTIIKTKTQCAQLITYKKQSLDLDLRPTNTSFRAGLISFCN